MDVVNNFEKQKNKSNKSSPFRLTKCFPGHIYVNLIFLNDFILQISIFITII